MVAKDCDMVFRFGMSSHVGLGWGMSSEGSMAPRGFRGEREDSEWERCVGSARILFSDCG
jgi:hypothetical protein